MRRVWFHRITLMGVLGLLLASGGITQDVQTNIGSYEALQTLAAGDAINCSTAVRYRAVPVAGSGGAVNLTSNPQIVAGSSAGQVCEVIATSDTNTVQIDDGDGISLLQTGGSLILKATATSRDHLFLRWNGTVWQQRAPVMSELTLDRVVRMGRLVETLDGLANAIWFGDGPDPDADSGFLIYVDATDGPMWEPRCGGGDCDREIAVATGKAITMGINEIIYLQIAGTDVTIPNGYSKPRFGTGTPTSGDCDAAGEAGRVYIQTDAADASMTWVCKGASGWKQQTGGSGDITAVWSCTTDNCDALTAASGDTFDAGSANASSPATRSTTQPGTCTEGQLHHETDSGGTELSICTDTNTFTKIGDVAADDTSTTVQNIVAYSTTGGKNLTELTGTQGDILYHNGTTWAKLAAGTSGHRLQTNGVGQNPSWTADSAVGVRSIYLPAAAMETSGGCFFIPAEVLLTNGPRLMTIGCTDADADSIEWDFVMPDGWNASTVTVELVAFSIGNNNAEVFEMDFAGQCVSSGESPAAHSTTGEQAAQITWGSSTNREQHATTNAITLNGTTCAAGDHLYFRGQVDATATTMTPMTDLKILGVKVEYTITGGD